MTEETNTLKDKEKPWYYGHRQRMTEKIKARGVDSLTESLENACDAVSMILADETDEAMNKYNRKVLRTQ